jgi:anhydro-N-acetylmuramic acid kinase
LLARGAGLSPLTGGGYTPPSAVGTEGGAKAISSRWIIGLASGFGEDRVEAALLEVEGVGLTLQVRIADSIQQPYPADLRELLLRQHQPQTCDLRQVSLLHRLLGETFAAAARQVADRASFSLQLAHLIGCSGQTVWHDVEGRFASSLALGMAAVVAERTSVTVVSDFRTRDMAAGGQGLPLAALVDYLLFRDREQDRVLVHLGSTARVVYVPADGKMQDMRGYEAGPCNLLLDALIRRLTGGRELYDAGGKYAVQGRCVDDLLERWLAHPYLQRRPPKSVPRNAFGDEFVAQTAQLARQHGWSSHDVLCTATHFVARAIVQSLDNYLPSGRANHVLLSGGGVRNGLLWHLLEQSAGRRLERTDEVGVAAGARQALSYGVLAALTMDSVPGNVPSATGAAGARLLGSITPGSPANWARCVHWMAGQVAPIAAAEDWT